jgi:hypothetical protein
MLCEYNFKLLDINFTCTFNMKTAPKQKIVFQVYYMLD